MEMLRHQKHPGIDRLTDEDQYEFLLYILIVTPVVLILLAVTILYICKVVVM